MSATPTAWWRFLTRARSHRRRGQEARHLQACRSLDAQPVAESRRQEALCRRRLAHQHRRDGHGGRGRPRRDLRARSRERQEPHLCVRPAQCGRHGVGAEHRRALDRGQRARRARRRDAAGLSDLGARRRLLRLALLLLGPDRRRSRAAGCGDGRESDHAGLCARRPHRLARPVLDAGGHAARLSRRHGDRPARLVESLDAVGLQGRVRAVRERPPVRPGARHPVGLPRARRARSPTAGRSASRSGPTARCWWPTMSAT